VAEFTSLWGIAADSQGHLYVTDHGNCVMHKIDRSDPSNPESQSFMGSFCSASDGTTTTGTGIGAGNFKKGGDGAGLKDVVHSNTALGEFLYVVGYHNLRRIDISDPSNPILGYAGTAPFAGTSTNGAAEGSRGTGQLSTPSGLAAVTSDLGSGIFSEGSILVSNGANTNQIRVVTPTGDIQAWSGVEGGFGFPQNGDASAGGDTPLAVKGNDSPSFVGLQGVAFDENNNAYVCDVDVFGNAYLIRKITSDGFPFKPADRDHFLGGATAAHCDGEGAAVSLTNPQKIVRDSEGFFIFIDEYRIKRLTLTSSGEGRVSTLAGSSNNQISDGTGSGASFKNPRALTIFNNTIYVACDTHIRAVDFVAPSAPSAPTISSYNSTAVVVKFGNSQYDGGPLFYHYVYSLRRMDSNEVVQTHIAQYEKDATLSEFTFSGLTAGKVYRVFSQGVNRVGRSSESTHQEFTTPLYCYGISFDNSTVCSGHGTCLTEDSCSCQPSYSGDQCEIYSCYGTLSTNAGVCTGHGSCVATDDCQCLTPGIYGHQCQIVECWGVNSTEASVCSAHGTCADYNSCQCSTNYSERSCSYYSCYGKPYNTSDTASLCSGRGSCIAHDTCSCSTGYTGDECETFSCYGTPFASPSVCSGHGSCVTPNNCSCQPTYGGNECNDFTCFGVANSDAGVCSSHGSCVARDTCSCNAGHNGEQCELFECFGYLSNDTARVCSGHGTCTAPATCACAGGFDGNDCSSAVCYGKTGNSSCSGPGRGTCSGLNNCTCSTGVLGDECQFYTCFSILSTDPLVCSAHGSCLNVDFCSCDEGYTDAACENLICYGYSAAHPQVCSGHGSCTAFDQCICSGDYFGTYCNSTLYNSFIVTPVTGKHIATAFQFIAISYAFASTSGFTYKYYYLDPVSGDKMYVGSTTDNFFYPPVKGDDLFIGADIATSHGTAMINATVKVESLSNIQLGNKDALLLDTTQDYNLEKFYTRSCTSRDYATNLIYLKSSVDVAYECSNPLFSIEAIDYASYSSFERNLITSTSPQCSLDQLFRLNPSKRVISTIAQHAYILECISAHTKDPSYLISHLRQYIVTADSSSFTEDSLTSFVKTTSQIVDFLISPEGKNDKAQSLINSGHVTEILRQLPQKMESFIGLGTSFPSVISSTNMRMALAKNTLSQLTSTFSSYEIGTTKGALRITLPPNFVASPTTTTILSMRAVVFEYDTFQWKNFAPASNITSMILSLQVYSPLSTNPLDIQGLTDDNLVRLSIPGTYDISKIQKDASKDKYLFRCQTWNTDNEEWTEDGCSLVDSLSSGNRMTCDCAKISGLIGVGLRYYAAPSNSTDDSNDPDAPLPPGVVGSGALDFLMDNWMMLVGLLAALIVLVLISMCCMACCLMCCMCLTRSRSGSKQVQPVILDPHQLKGVHTTQAWDDVMDDNDDFSDLDSLSDDSSSNSDLEHMETERTTESSSSPHGDDQLDEEDKMKREEQRALEKKRRKEKERRRKIKEMKRMSRMIRKSSSGMPRKQRRRKASMTTSGRRNRRQRTEDEMRPDEVVQVERMKSVGDMDETPRDMNA